MNLHFTANNRPMTRIAAVGLSLCILFSFLVVFTGCSRRQGVYTTSFLDTFDTVLTVTVGADTREQATEWTTALHGIARDLHDQFSIYDSFSTFNNLHTVNRLAGHDQPVKVSREIVELITVGKDIYVLSDGAVNICMGNLLAEWRRAKENSRVPAKEVVDVFLREQSSMDRLVIDEKNSTVHITWGNMSVDVGAIAKGYVLAKMRQYAETEGITSLLVNFGGQVMAIGRHPDGNPWTVAIRDPRDGSELTRIQVEDAVVATSADDQRTYTVDGVSYHHIIDPATGYPARLYRSVTVILPLEHTTYSDGFSTALFIMNREDGQSLIDTYGGSALWLTAEGEVVEYNRPNSK